jgi:predicted MFS family arabinose efflux permease
MSATDPTPTRPARRMTPGLTLLFAIAAGAAVGNLYAAQPLLDDIAGDLHASASSAGWLITATQIGYAVGILLIVPLGDVRNRKRLIPLMMLCSAAALVLCALTPSLALLLVAISLLGLTTVAGQILAPLAGDLTDDDRRGRVIGTVVSGILTGILVSRTVSGLIAGALGWRAVFGAAAAVDILFAAALYRRIPPLAPKTRIAYPALIVSIWTVTRRERTLRWTLAMGATGFGAFTMFWTSLTFLLSAPPFSYSTSTIGLFGLAGLAGAIAAQRVGRLHDRGWSLPVIGAAWALALLAFALAMLAGDSVALLVVAIVALDIAIQALFILNQTRAFAISREERSRINTAVITTNFIGGAIGSAIASVLWAVDGWTAVTAAGIALTGLGLVIWAIGRRGPLIVPAADAVAAP